MTTNYQIKIRTSFSFRPFVEELKKRCGDEPEIKDLLLRIEKQPEILKEYDGYNQELLQKPLVKELLSLLFPKMALKTSIQGMLQPYTDYVLHATEEFRNLFMGDNNELDLFQKKSNSVNIRFKLLNAYFLIAKRVYNLDIALPFEKIIDCVNPRTGLVNYFVLSFDSDYLDVKPRKKPRTLSKKEKEHLLEHADDLELWQSMFRLDDFEIQGLIVLCATEVTQSQVFSSMQQDLIENESLLNFDRFMKVQEKVTTLLQIKDVVLAIFAIENDRVFVINKGIPEEARRNHILCNQWFVDNFRDSIFAQVIEAKQPIIINDVRKLEHKTEVENSMLEKGFKAVLFTPLYHEGKIIGILELISTKADVFQPMMKIQVEHLVPLFSLAIKKVLDDMNQNVQLHIQEKYTAIHPSVSWRFRQAALRYLQKEAAGKEARVEDIIFHDVYPLFAMSDIRGSSERRNHAIQEDLLAQLRSAQAILQKQYEISQLSYTDNLLYKIEKKMHRIEFGLHTGDEASIVDFFKSEVDPALEKLVHLSPELNEELQAYKKLLDVDHGVIYDVRKEYDNDINIVNATLSDFIDRKNQEMQEICPHYFEKNATDGVDFSIYIGEELVEDNHYDPLFLKELRLWQLKTLCGVANEAEKLKKITHEPVGVTHLILVQHMPLTIQYRLEDTQFVVSGSYNIRYEILKKRIDKAKVKNSSERITQPGQIAIIYSQHKEKMEYLEYIEYLVDKKLLADHVDELELEELQGVSGLQALRVTPIIYL